MRKIALFLVCIPFFKVWAQDSAVITLQECYQLAVQNNPMTKDKNAINQSYEIKQHNLNSYWLPQLNMTGQATYQSDITRIDLTLPPQFPAIDIPVPRKDQYKIYLDVNQTIYDGGLVKSSKKAEEINTNVNLQQTDVEIDKIKDQINNVFFLIILLDKNKEISQIFLNEIRERKEDIESGIKNGINSPVNLDILEAEELKIKQQITEIDLKKDASYSVLSILTGNQINASIHLVLPEMPIDTTKTLSRPELKLFDLQKTSLDATKKVIYTQRMPRVYGFSQAGVGNPALNMFSDKFEPYFIVGLGMKWNIWDWNKNKNDRQLLDIQKSLIDSKQQNFERNISVGLYNNIAEIERLKELIQTDEQLVILRKKISKTQQSLLEKGIIAATAYLTELDAEKQSEINLETHKIQLIQSETINLLIKGIW